MLTFVDNINLRKAFQINKNKFLNLKRWGLI